MTVSTYSGGIRQRTELLAALRQLGFALHAEGDCRAGVFTLQVYRSIRGSPTDAAFAAAAAVELQMEAAFLLDSVADDDSGTGATSGRAEALAVAVALLECGSCAACDAVLAADRGLVGVEALREFHRSCVAACEGQFLDARFERRQDVTTDEALEMTCRKSGSLGRLAGGFGARTATSESTLISSFEELGSNLFTFAQLVDDLRDACRPDGRSDDVARAKKTVPLVFFYHQCGSTPTETESCTIDSSWGSTWRAYAESGARSYGAVVAETFLNRAKKNLMSLDGQRCAVGDLERFVKDLEDAFHEVLATS